MSMSFCWQAPFDNFNELYTIDFEKPVLKLNHVIYWRFEVFYMLTWAFNYVDEHMHKHVKSGNWRAVIKIFDSSYNRGKPLTFQVGVGEVCHIIS